MSLLASSKLSVGNVPYYEMATLTELRNCIRSGDVSVSGSRKYKNFDDYLVSKSEWAKVSSQDHHLAVSSCFDEFMEERSNSLAKRLKWVSNHAHDLEGVNLDEGKIHVERLDKETPEEAKALSSELYNMLPRVKLTDLLMEVAGWTGFDEMFLHASTCRAPKDEERPTLTATLMAMGMNIGLSKMANATPGISYRQIANVSQWRMHDDAMNQARAKLINFQHNLGLPYYWGDGSTSSSDGMRVGIGVPSLFAGHNPHFGHGKGLTFYRSVSDQYAAYQGNVVNSNTRDALYWVDALLHHETELDIKEHYTDTAGYTDQVFGLCHLLSFQFAPPLRDIGSAKLWVIGDKKEYPKLEPLLKGRVKLKSIRENYDDLLRLAYSIREAKVSAALMLGKLGSYARKNQLATGLTEAGKIEKTIFILDYLSSRAVRRKINRGLNKGEAMNALARAVFFAQCGELRERALQAQLQRNSALDILINAISVWNTVYLTEAIKVLKEKRILTKTCLNIFLH